MTAMDEARRIADALERVGINISTEDAAHRGVAAALTAAGIAFDYEVVLSPANRIDFMCGAVGVEVKIGHPRRKVWQQLERYAAMEQVAALVLVTGAAWPQGTNEVGGKGLIVASLSKGWL